MMLAETSGAERHLDCSQHRPGLGKTLRRTQETVCCVCLSVFVNPTVGLSLTPTHGALQTGEEHIMDASTVTAFLECEQKHTTITFSTVSMTMS